MVNLIGNIGFPIAMCIILVSFIKDMQNKHTAELLKLAETVKSNTIAIDNLSELIKNGK